MLFIKLAYSRIIEGLGQVRLGQVRLFTSCSFRILNLDRICTDYFTVVQYYILCYNNNNTYRLQIIVPRFKNTTTIIVQIYEQLLRPVFVFPAMTPRKAYNYSRHVSCCATILLASHDHTHDCRCSHLECLGRKLLALVTLEGRDSFSFLSRLIPCHEAGGLVTAFPSTIIYWILSSFLQHSH